MGELMPGAAETDLDRAAEVQAWLDARADEMAELLEELVASTPRTRPAASSGAARRCCATR